MIQTRYAAIFFQIRFLGKYKQIITAFRPILGRGAKPCPISVAPVQFEPHCLLIKGDLVIKVCHFERDVADTSTRVDGKFCFILYLCLIHFSSLSKDISIAKGPTTSEFLCSP